MVLTIKTRGTALPAMAAVPGPFNDADKAFIESVSFFFIATADAAGRPDCSHKGGAPGFVRVVAPDLLVFPDYDGNGMFRSLGNLSVNPQVGLLFIAMSEKPKRLRVNGRAVLTFDDPLMAWKYSARALASGFRYSPSRPLTKLRIPHLVLLGERDPMTPFEYTRGIYAQLEGDKEWVTIPDAGHMGGLAEHQDEVLDAVDDFLGRRMPVA